MSVTISNNNTGLGLGLLVGILVGLSVTTGCILGIFDGEFVGLLVTIVGDFDGLSVETTAAIGEVDGRSVTGFFVGLLVTGNCVVCLDGLSVVAGSSRAFAVGLLVPISARITGNGGLEVTSLAG